MESAIEGLLKKVLFNRPSMFFGCKERGQGVPFCFA